VQRFSSFESFGELLEATPRSPADWTPRWKVLLGWVARLDAPQPSPWLAFGAESGGRSRGRGSPSSSSITRVLPKEPVLGLLGLGSALPPMPGRCQLLQRSPTCPSSLARPLITFCSR